MIPRLAHFVFGLEEQREPFHFLHYVSIESCRRALAPEAIYVHHKHLPWGPWWDRIRPYLTLVEVDQASEVLDADYSGGRVPHAYRYAHHADFIRLDVLIEYGGVYADIDTIFVRPFPDELFDAQFVIGREPPVLDERTGESRPSLCNALLMAAPGAPFATAWREEMPKALNGTWSNHSGFLSHDLSRRMPEAVRVEPEVSFFSFPATPGGLSALLQERHTPAEGALSVHLWAHLWWDRRRRDFSQAHAGWYTASSIDTTRTTLADLARPYLPSRPGEGPVTWNYLSLDEDSGYGVAAQRCIAALKESELQVDWTPFVSGTAMGLAYEPALPCEGSRSVVVAHLPPEYLPPIRERNPDAFLVGHTVWETDRLPDHWPPCLDAADLLIVPSRLSAEAIAAAPVDTPFAVVPHAAPPIGPPDPARWPAVPADTFVFYTIADWTERKAVAKTVEAYLSAFTGRDRVLLIVKTSHRDHTSPRPPGAGAVGQGTTAWALARLLAGRENPPAVSLVTRRLSGDEISALHRRGDCFVSLCRSEGWGLGAFDAAAHGNPVVTTGFGGHLDYLAESQYLVDYELVPVIDPHGLPSYAPDQRWGEPHIDHGAALLREIAAAPDRAKSHAASIAADVNWRYRPQAIASAFRSAVEEHCRPRAQDSAAAGAPARRG